MTSSVWRKASRSGTQQGNCVELANLRGGTIGVRDSKSPDHGHLTLTPEAFADLLARAKRDQLNP